MKCSFKLFHYADCLDLALEKDYKILPLCECLNGVSDKVIALRHDIDRVSEIRLAKKMGDLEFSKGIRSTYFIRLHADYNLMSYQNYTVLMDLIDKGHEIGLHYEGDFGSLFGKDSLEFFKRDKRILEDIIGMKIYGISAHNPNQTKLKIKREDLQMLGLKYDAFDNIFIRDMKYISDSSGRWREGCVCKFIKRETPRLCVLIHPLRWYYLSPSENF